MDGLVVYSCLGDDEASRTPMKRRLPMVLVDQPAQPGISSVKSRTSRRRPGSAHVVESGHRQVGIVVPWLDAPEGVAGFDPESLAPGKLRDRLRGWCGTLRDAGVPYRVFGLPLMAAIVTMMVANALVNGAVAMQSATLSSRPTIRR